MNPKGLIVGLLAGFALLAVATVLHTRRVRLRRTTLPRWRVTEILILIVGVTGPALLGYLIVMPSYRRALEEYERMQREQQLRGPGQVAPSHTVR